MNGELLLDTNAIIALLEGDVAIRERVGDSPTLLLSVNVLGELYYGAHKSTRAAANLARINNLVATSTVLLCEVATAMEYGRIKNELRQEGRPIPEGDIWIAALARQRGFVLISRDQHFARISNLRWEQW